MRFLSSWLFMKAFSAFDTDFLCDKEIYMKTNSEKYLNCDSGGRRPRLIDQNVGPGFKWRVSCKSNKNGGATKFMFTSENNRSLYWKNFGGVELKSNDMSSKNAYWKIIEDSSGRDFGLYKISSAEKTKTSKRSSSRHCMTEWLAGGILTTTPCNFNQGAGFFFEMLNQENAYSEWTSWGSCAEIECTQSRRRECKVLNCVEPLIEFQTCPLEETIKNHNWNSWSECNDGQRVRSRRVSSKCGSLFLKKYPNYHIREQSSQTGECTACTPPEWSDWERDDSGCMLVRKCIVLDDQDESCNKECIGKSKKEVPCITATICNKVVQLTNHRDKALTLRRSNYESKLTYRYSSETPSLDSVWTICCSPEDGQNVAVLYNEPNNLKLIKDYQSDRLIGSHCRDNRCIGRDLWKIHDYPLQSKARLEYEAKHRRFVDAYSYPKLFKIGRKARDSDKVRTTFGVNVISDANCHAFRSTECDSNWSEWDKCDARCGSGIRQRRKFCYGMLEEDNEPCIAMDENDEEILCEECVWSDWSPCSATSCGGESERIQTCTDNRVNDVEKMMCNSQAFTVWTDWRRISECDENCLAVEERDCIIICGIQDGGCEGENRRNVSCAEDECSNETVVFATEIPKIGRAGPMETTSEEATTISDAATVKMTTATPESRAMTTEQSFKISTPESRTTESVATTFSTEKRAATSTSIILTTTATATTTILETTMTSADKLLTTIPSWSTVALTTTTTTTTTTTITTSTTSTTTTTTTTTSTTRPTTTVFITTTAPSTTTALTTTKLTTAGSTTTLSTTTSTTTTSMTTTKDLVEPEYCSKAPQPSMSDLCGSEIMLYSIQQQAFLGMKNEITDNVNLNRFYDEINSTLELECFETPKDSQFQNTRFKLTTSSGEFYLGYSNDYKKRLTIYAAEKFDAYEQELTKFQILIEKRGDIPFSRIRIPGGNFYLSARGSVRITPVRRAINEWLAIPPIPSCAFSSWTSWGDCSATCGKSSRSRERVPVGDFAMWKLTTTFYKIFTSEPCDVSICKDYSESNYYDLYAE